jgi:hypothetical protein
MKDDTYNGWTNYETWCVNLWLDNDEYLNNTLNDIATDEDVDLYDKCEQLKAVVDAMNPLYGDASMFTDMLNGALSMVCWKEIIENHLDD